MVAYRTRHDEDSEENTGVGRTFAPHAIVDSDMTAVIVSFQRGGGSSDPLLRRAFALTHLFKRLGNLFIPTLGVPHRDSHITVAERLSNESDIS